MEKIKDRSIKDHSICIRNSQSSKIKIYTEMEEFLFLSSSYVRKLTIVKKQWSSISRVSGIDQKVCYQASEAQWKGILFSFFFFFFFCTIENKTFYSTASNTRRKKNSLQETPINLSVIPIDRACKEKLAFPCSGVETLNSFPASEKRPQQRHVSLVQEPSPSRYTAATACS